MALVFFLINLLIYAQAEQKEQKESKTELEKFFSKSGVIIIREYTQTQILSGDSYTQINLQGIKSYYPGEKEFIKGLRITITNQSKEAIAFLDLEEVESLSKALLYIIENIKIFESYEYYTEIEFRTKGNFEMGIFKSDNKIKFYTKINKYPYPFFYADVNTIIAFSSLVSKFYNAIQNM